MLKEAFILFHVRCTDDLKAKFHGIHWLNIYDSWPTHSRIGAI